jgi:hypothetical protein
MFPFSDSHGMSKAVDPGRDVPVIAARVRPLGRVKFDAQPSKFSLDYAG